MRLALLPGALALSLFTAAGCKTIEHEASAETRASAAPAPTSAPAANGEVVFDPNNPPEGWVNCHRNHCHHKDGRVASYAQVMQEIGAKKMVGGDAPVAAPAAPPDVAAFPMDADKLPSGLVTRVLKAGKGDKKPGPKSVVTVHYTGWTTDGKSFDSSLTRGKPAQVPLHRMMPGWIEGLQLMVVGEERRFWIPEGLAYKGQAGKPAGTLVFDVELIEVRD